MSETKQTTTPATALSAVKPPEETIATRAPIGVFSDPKEFSQAQRVAKMLVLSSLMPEHFRGEENLPSAIIAVDIAMRLRLNPLMVAQQIYLVHGKPGFSAQFVIGVMNSNAKFGKLRYDIQSKGSKKITAAYTEWVGGQKQRKTVEVSIEDLECIAWTIDGKDELLKGVNTLAKAKESGLVVLEGPPVSIEMAVKEGWYTKDGSKWPTMPLLMLRYRAAAFFSRLYAPELTMGLPTVDELEDIAPPEPAFTKPVFGQVTDVPESPPPIEESPPGQAAAATPTIQPPPGDQNASQVNIEIKSPAPVPEKLPNPILHLRRLCKESGISEEKLISFLKSIRSVKDGMNSFEEIQLADSRVLGMAVEQFDELKKLIVKP